MKHHLLLGLVLASGIFFKQAEAAWCQPCNTEPEWCEAPSYCPPCPPCSPCPPCAPPCPPCPPCAPVCDASYYNGSAPTYYNGNGGGYYGGGFGDFEEFDNGWGTFGLYGQFLYWGLYGEELDFAEINIHFPVNVAQTIWEDNCETLEHTFSWKPGVRVGVFYQGPNRGADVAFEWTYYRNSNTENYLFVPPGTGGINFGSVYLLDPTPSSLIASGFLSSLALTSNMSFRINHFLLKYGDVVDWDCGFSFHPYVGPVFYQTNQNISVGMTATNTTPVSTDVQAIRVNTTARAVGAKIGTDYSYEFFEGFALVGDLGLSGVAADFKLDGTLDTAYTVTGVLDTANTYNFYDKKWQARAVLDLSIGFRYSTCFCSCYHFFTQIEWEYHQYFNQTSFLLKDLSTTPTAELFGRGVKGFTRSQADLIMQGLSVSVGFAF